MTIGKALDAVQSFGVNPDNAVIIVIYTTPGQHWKKSGVKGFWYDEEILEWSEKEAKGILISVDSEETKITAIFG